jgi:hypothetical protein
MVLRIANTLEGVQESMRSDILAVHLQIKDPKGDQIGLLAIWLAETALSILVLGFLPIKSAKKVTQLR